MGLKTKEAFDFVVLGHHADDLLETRLIRLIRGVGAEGLPSMSFRDGDRLRPLLSLSRNELETFV